jgi:NADPH:quinone reductase-like Zn-dependent oxidoreductase
MKAIVYRKYGPPDVLKLEDIKKPEPKEDELLIRVHAAEATKADCEMRSFKFPVLWFWLPLRIALGVRGPKNIVLGGYFSGEVVKVGPGASRFDIGDPVYGTTGLRFGAYGQFVCLPQGNSIAKIPENIDPNAAASVLLGGLNALHYMKKAGIRRGEKVLINGAGGSIGIYAVQIARAMGAEVTAVDSAIKQDFLRRTGADHCIDYAEGHFSGYGQKYDVIFDMIAQKSYSRCIGALNAGGRYLMANPRVSDMLRAVITTRFSHKTVGFAFAGEKQDELDELGKMIEDETIKPVIDRTFVMTQAANAHQRVETEQRLGPVVIDLINSQAI